MAKVAVFTFHFYKVCVSKCYAIQGPDFQKENRYCITPQTAPTYPAALLTSSTHARFAAILYISVLITSNG